MIDKEKEKFRASVSKSAFDTRIKALDYFDDITNNLRTVNELSTGLGLVSPDKGFATTYGSVLGVQSNILDGVLSLDKELELGSFVRNGLMASVAPLSGVIAKIGLMNANAHKLLEMGTITGDTSIATIKLSDALLGGISGQQAIFASNLKFAGESGILNMSGALNSARVVSSGVNSMLRSLPSYSPNLTVPSLESIQKASIVTDKELSEYQRELDNMLERINPELVEYRRGCWHALQNEGPDHFGQASSSMRRLVDNLLRTLAPNEKVTETAYFKNSETGKGGKDDHGNPSRKARLFFILKCDGNKKKEHLIRLTEGFLKIYDSLPAWDHMPLKKKLFVKGIFIAIEGNLTAILSENETNTKTI